MQGNSNINSAFAALTPQQQQQFLAAAAARGQQQPGAVWPGGPLGQQQQQPPARTVSPVPGQQQQLASATAQQQAAQLAKQRQQLQQLQLQALVQQQQQQARPLGVAGPGGAGRGGPGAGGLASVGSASNLAALNAALGLNPAALAAAAAAQGAAGGLALQRPGSTGLLSAAAAAAGARPGMFAGRPPLGGLGAAGSGVLGPGGMGGAAGGLPLPDPDAALKSKVQTSIKAMKPNEAPKVEPPEGHEWLQCLGKDGKPGWFAVVKAKAASLRASTAAAAAAAAGGKRKAEDAAAGQPVGKRKKAADDELVAGGGDQQTKIMTDDAVEAEEAAAKGTLVVEAGNVQEEYLLDPSSTLRLVARLAKEGGVGAVSDAVYPYLSLAAETFLSQLLNAMVKMRLQREDLGRGYYGFEQGDTSVRAELYKMREREKKEAERRAQVERDELAKLGASRKKLGDEERKAAQAARQQRDIEQKRASVGNTLNILGIRHAAFSTFGKAASKTGAAKPGMTRAELSEAKAAAAEAPVPASTNNNAAAAAGGGGGPQDGKQDGAAAASASQPAAAAGPGAGSGPASTGAPALPSTAAAVTGPPPLKPMSLQHQLLTAADLASQAAVPFVAGGVAARKVGARGGGAGDGSAEPLRELMLADLVAVLERHPLYSRSPELYKLHVLAQMQADTLR